MFFESSFQQRRHFIDLLTNTLFDMISNILSNYIDMFVCCVNNEMAPIMSVSMPIVDASFVLKIDIHLSLRKIHTHTHKLTHLSASFSDTGCCHRILCVYLLDIRLRENCRMSTISLGESD